VTNDGGLWVADGFTLADVERAERAAMAAWPAAETVDLDGWLGRRTFDTLSRRANSAVAEASPLGGDVDAAIRKVEDYYDGNGGTPRFQMSPTSMPDTLDATLADKGYVIEAPVRVMTAAPGRVARNEDWPVRLDERPDAAWRAAFHEVAPMPGEADGRTAMVERARRNGLDVAFASVRDDDGSVMALGTGVFGREAAAHDGWALIFSMNTPARHRRRGLGSAILGALMARALESGGEVAYLQVETNNPVAVSMYERLGFTDLYAYHYRTLRRAPKVG